MGCCKSGDKTVDDFEGMSMNDQKNLLHDAQTSNTRHDQNETKTDKNRITSKSQRPNSHLSEVSEHKSQKFQNNQNQSLHSLSRVSSKKSLKNINITSPRQELKSPDVGVGRKNNQHIMKTRYQKPSQISVSNIKSSNPLEDQKKPKQSFKIPPGLQNKNLTNSAANRQIDQGKPNQNGMVKSNIGPKFSKMYSTNKNSNNTVSQIKSVKSENGFTMVTSSYKRNTEAKISIPKENITSEKDKQFIQNIEEDSEIEESEIINHKQEESERDMTRTYNLKPSQYKEANLRVTN